MAELSFTRTGKRNMGCVYSSCLIIWPMWSLDTFTTGPNFLLFRDQFCSTTATYREQIVQHVMDTEIAPNTTPMMVKLNSCVYAMASWLTGTNPLPYQQLIYHISVDLCCNWDVIIKKLTPHRIYKDTKSRYFALGRIDLFKTETNICWQIWLICLFFLLSYSFVLNVPNFI